MVLGAIALSVICGFFKHMVRIAAASHVLEIGSPIFGSTDLVNALSSSSTAFDRCVMGMV